LNEYASAERADIDDTALVLKMWTGELAALRKQIAQTAQDASWLILRLIYLLFDLLIRIDEGRTGKTGSSKPEA